MFQNKGKAVSNKVGFVLDSGEICGIDLDKIIGFCVYASRSTVELTINGGEEGLTYSPA